jgi:hypothetical protein
MNPYLIHSGIFMPHYLLSNPHISHGAKLIYRLLIEKIDHKGETLASIPILANAIADEEQSVLGFITELERTKYIKVQRHPADTKFIRCYFPRPAWVKPNDAKQRRTNRDNKRRADQPKVKPASRHSRDTCIKYAFACQKAKGRINAPYAFANHLFCTGAQDEEIDQYLAAQQDEAHAA